MALATVAAVVAVLLPVVAPVGQSAWGSPKSSADSAQAGLDALNNKVDVVVEDYDEAQVKLDSARKDLAAAKDRLARQQAKVGALKDRFGAVAASAYRGESASNAVALLASDDPGQFLSRSSTLQVVAGQMHGQLQEVKAARNRLAQQHKELAQREASIQAMEKSLAAKKVKLDALVARQEKLLKAAKVAEAAQAAADRTRADTEARARASRAAQRPPVYTGPISGRAAKAVAYAKAQLGKAYRVAGDGPRAFDCSGLTMRAWGAAGVYLPHSSRAQFHYGHHVPVSQLRPGDLVFFGHPIHHVGIYVGGGEFIEAPHTGADVRYATLSDRMGNYVGAIRL